MKETYRKLRGRIVEKFGTVEAFSKALGCSRQSVYNKLNGITDMSRTEMKFWSDVLSIEENEIPTYFF